MDGGGRPSDLELTLFGGHITEEAMRERIAFLMMRLPQVPHLVASISEIEDMDLGMFMFLIEKKAELIREATEKKR